MATKRQGKPAQILQTWFFLYESTESTNHHLCHDILTSAEAQNIRLLEMLEKAQIKGDISDFALFIHTRSIPQPQLLQNDKGIPELWKQFENDPVVTIHIRVQTEPHPADLRSMSFAETLEARRTIVKGGSCLEYEMRTTAPYAPEPRIETWQREFCGNTTKKQILVWTANETWCVPKMVGDLRIHVRTGEEGWMGDRAFPASCLLSIIRDQIRSGRTATEVELEYCTGWTGSSEGTRFRKLRLSTRIWEESLLRGPWKTMFQYYWSNMPLACGGYVEEDGESTNYMVKMSSDSRASKDSGYHSEREDAESLKELSWEMIPPVD